MRAAQLEVLGCQSRAETGVSTLKAPLMSAARVAEINRCTDPILA